MAEGISRFLNKFPEHKARVGDILVSYGELEAEMVQLVSTAAGTPEDNAVRILYRLRGAQQRLDVAEAIMYPFYTKIGLGDEFGAWLGAMRRCKVIRNQYAHCGWFARPGKLMVCDLEAAGRSKDGVVKLDFWPVKLELLDDQLAYFNYALEITFYLQREARYRKDRRRRHARQMPRSRAAPNLDSRRG